MTGSRGMNDIAAMMEPPPFGRGIGAVLMGEWSLVLKTPLCLRSGHHSAFIPTGGGSKTRFVDMGFHWNTPAEGDAQVQVADLVFGPRVADGKVVEPQYVIPARSVRGALRSWSIRHLLEEPQRVFFKMAELPLPPPNPGALMLLGLFGIASGEGENEGENNDGGEPSYSRAGRLRMETRELRRPPTGPSLNSAGNWKAGGRPNNFGPENACRHIALRGPVDRITHAAREGGLHYFLEFSAEQRFDVVIRIANPEPAHLELLYLWERELQYGTLRLGGLTSIGRGRMGVDHSRYSLHAGFGCETAAWRNWISGEAEGDPFGVWRAFELARGGPKVAFERLPSVFARTAGSEAGSVRE